MESVQVVESCLVAPSEATPTPTKGLWLSPLDVALANLGHGAVALLYRSGATFFDVPRLKAAMAKALVAFYPLAGRLGVDDDGRLEIRCNGEGALFVVARSCHTAEDVDLSKPTPLLKTLFVPSIEPEVPLILATQVTFLRCGAVVFAVSVHHAAVDGTGTSHFMQTWSALYRRDNGDENGSTAADLLAPCHDHTLLRARSPPAIDPDALSLLYRYDPPNKAAVVTSGLPAPAVTEVFPISRDQLVTLKRRCGDGGGWATTASASTFVSLSALVWQCVTVLRRLPPDAIMRLSFPINFRPHVRPPLPTGYFGNAAVSLCATGAAARIAYEALSSVAARIRGAIARMDDQLVRTFIDCVELQLAWARSGDMPETDLEIVSWLNMPLGLDLGSGAPQAVTRHMGTIARGLVFLIDDHDGGVGVVVHMDPGSINEFQRLLYAGIENKHQASASSKL